MWFQNQAVVSQHRFMEEQDKCSFFFIAHYLFSTASCFSACLCWASHGLPPCMQQTENQTSWPWHSKFNEGFPLTIFFPRFTNGHRHSGQSIPIQHWHPSSTPHLWLVILQGVLQTRGEVASKRVCFQTVSCINKNRTRTTIFWKSVPHPNSGAKNGNASATTSRSFAPAENQGRRPEALHVPALCTTNFKRLQGRISGFQSAKPTPMAWKGTTQRPSGNPPCKENLGAGHGVEGQNLKTCCMGQVVLGTTCPLRLSFVWEANSARLGCWTQKHPWHHCTCHCILVAKLQVEAINHLRFSSWSRPVGSRSPHLLARLVVAPWLLGTTWITTADSLLSQVPETANIFFLKV